MKRSATSARTDANQEALELLKMARRLVEPQPAEAMLNQAKRALMKLQRVIYKLQGAQASPVERVPSELEIAMVGLRDSLDEILDPFGFCLLVFDVSAEARVSWITKAGVREADVAQLMQFYIEAHGQ